MPEGPEVQTIVSDLEKTCCFSTIIDIQIYPRTKNLLKNTDFEFFKNKVVNKSITAVTRLGKNIVISLSSGYSLIIHLVMTGQIIIGTSLPKYTRLSLQLDNKKNIYLADKRTWAQLDLLQTTEINKQKKFASLGIDIFSNAFTLENFQSQIKGKKAIYTLLLDQRCISGLGNIYVNECLYDACVNPFKTARDLSNEEVSRLYFSICAITSQALKYKGSTFSDYRLPSGDIGSYQNHLKIFRKAGLSCQKCKSIILKRKKTGRSVFYCPVCQDLVPAHPVCYDT